MAAQSIGEAFVRVRPDTTGFAAETRRGVRSSLAGLGKLTVGAGAFVGLTGAAVALQKGVDVSVQFERGLRNVNSIANLTDKQLGNVGDQLLRLGERTGQVPTTLAKGLYDIVSSGFNAADAVKILSSSTKAASAGLTDTATATAAIDAALNAYHQTAGEATNVSDVLFQVVNKGVLTFGELAQNMGDLVPAAAPLGISLKEVGSAIATVTLQGVPAAEAATRVKNTMLQLSSPSKNLAKFLKDQGFASAEAAIKSVGYAGVLDLINKRTGGAVTATSKLFPEMRAALGVIGLTGKNAQTYTNILKSMDSATAGAGMTQHAFAEQQKTVSFRAAQAKAAFAATAIELTADLLPSINSSIQGSIRFAHWLERSEDVHRALHGVVAGTSAVYRTMADVIEAAAPVLRGAASAIEEVSSVAGAGGILTFAAAWVATTKAIGLGQAVLVKWTALQAEYVASQTASATATATGTAAVGSNTAALTANTAATTANVAAKAASVGASAASGAAGAATTAGTFLQGPGGRIVSPYSSPQAFAQAEKELAAMRASGAAAATAGTRFGSLRFALRRAAPALGETGAAAGVAGARMGALGLAARSLVSPTTLAVAATAGVAYGLYKIITRESDAERANDRLKDSVNRLRSSLVNLHDREEELTQLRLDIPIRRAAVEAGRLAIAQDKQNISTSKAAHGSLEYRRLLNQLASDEANYRQLVDGLKQARSEEAAKTREVTQASKAAASARRGEVSSAVELASRYRSSLAETRQELEQIDESQILGSKADVIRAGTTKQAQQNLDGFTKSLREDADAAKNQQYPQLRRNLDLLADFVDTVHRLPTRREVSVVLNLEHEEDLRALIRDLRDLRGLPQSVGDAAIESPRTTAHDSAHVAAQRAADAARDAAKVVGGGATAAAEHVTRKMREFHFTVTSSLQDAAQRIRDAQQSVADTIKQGQQAVDESVQQAKQNLNSLGQSLSSALDDFFDKLKPPARAQRLTGPLLKEFQALKAQLKSGSADAEEVQRRASQLSTSLQARAAQAGAGGAGTTDAALTARKERVQRALADLTDLRNKGAITEAVFERRLSRLLRHEGVTRGAVRRRLGVAAADEFTALSEGLRDQGRALAAGPQRRGTGLEVALVRPLQALKDAEKANSAAQLEVSQAQKELQSQTLEEMKKQTHEFRVATNHLRKIERKTGVQAPPHRAAPRGAAAQKAAETAAAGLGG